MNFALYYPFAAYNQGFMEALESARCIQPPVEEGRHSKRRRLMFVLISLVFFHFFVVSNI